MIIYKKGKLMQRARALMPVTSELGILVGCSVPDFMQSDKRGRRSMPNHWQATTMARVRARSILFVVGPGNQAIN